MNLTLFIIGCLWVGMGLIMKTKNFASSFLFKIIPMFSGLFTMYYAAKAMGWL